VRLDELVDTDGVAEDLGKLLATSIFTLTGTVGKEDVRNLDSELVITVEDLEGALTLGDQTITVNQDTVNVESESHVLGGLDLLAREVLNLGCQNLAGGLDWGHTRATGLGIRVVDR
jgi:hypothetical protein